MGGGICRFPAGRGNDARHVVRGPRQETCGRAGAPAPGTAGAPTPGTGSPRPPARGRRRPVATTSSSNRMAAPGAGGQGGAARPHPRLTRAARRPRRDLAAIAAPRGGEELPAPGPGTHAPLRRHSAAPEIDAGAGIPPPRASAVRSRPSRGPARRWGAEPRVRPFNSCPPGTGRRGRSASGSWHRWPGSWSRHTGGRAAPAPGS